MKKALFILLILFITTISFSQNFNGDFRCFKTSFKDISNPVNNFNANSEFRIAVMIDENHEDGSIVVQDPKTPNKLLIYQVIDYIGTLEDKGITSYLYRCKTEHLNIPIETTIVFYYTIDKKLNLLIKTEKLSQAFHDIQKVSDLKKLN